MSAAVRMEQKKKRQRHTAPKVQQESCQHSQKKRRRTANPCELSLRPLCDSKLPKMQAESQVSLKKSVKKLIITIYQYHFL